MLVLLKYKQLSPYGLKELRGLSFNLLLPQGGCGLIVTLPILIRVMATWMRSLCEKIVSRYIPDLCTFLYMNVLLKKKLYGK